MLHCRNALININKIFRLWEKKFRSRLNESAKNRLVMWDSFRRRLRKYSKRFRLPRFLVKKIFIQRKNRIFRIDFEIRHKPTDRSCFTILHYWCFGIVLRFITFLKNTLNGGGGNWTRIQELRPGDSTRLVHLLKVSSVKSQQMNKTFWRTSPT